MGAPFATVRVFPQAPLRLQGCHAGGECVAALLEVFELIPRRASGREKDDRTRDAVAEGWVCHQLGGAALSQNLLQLLHFIQKLVAAIIFVLENPERGEGGTHHDSVVLV